MSHITGHPQLDANAVPFDPEIGFLPDEDKQFALFQHLQTVNTQMQTLEQQMNHISIPTFNQINNQMLTAAYLNPSLYLQLQQQQLCIRQVVVQQQQQLQTLKQIATKLQKAYHEAQESASDASQSPVNTPRAVPQSASFETAKYPETNRNKSPLAMILEHSFEIHEDDEEDEVTSNGSSESPEYPLTSSMADTIIEANDHSAAISPQHENRATYSYSMRDLMSFQSQFVDIQWSKYPEIPYEIRFIGSDFNHKTFMDDMLAAISRRCAQRFSDRKVCNDSNEKAMKKLKGILNKMTPTKFDKIAKETMDVILEHAKSEHEMKDILRLILEFGTKQSVFSEQYARLINHVLAYLPRLRIISDYDWIVSDDQLSKTFRTMVIIESHKLFYHYINHSVIDKEEEEEEEELMQLQKAKQKKTFIDFLKLCGNLYNVDILKIGVIYKGIIDELLPPKNTGLCEIDMEGICELFKQCGDKLDEENTVRLDTYLQKIKRLSDGFGFRTRCLVDEIGEMRLKDWTHRIHKDKPKELDVLKKEFEDEQLQKQQAPTRTKHNMYPKKRYQEREDARYRKHAYYVQDTKRNKTKRTDKRRRDRQYTDDYGYDYYANGESKASYYKSSSYGSKRSQSRRYQQDEYDYNNGHEEYRGYKQSRSRRSNSSHSYAQRHRSYGNYY